MSARTVTFTALALFAFAGNSLLCRIALKLTAIDAASFTAVRLLSGAFVLAAIVKIRDVRPIRAGSWISAAALFIYAAGFSFAYAGMSAATGALLLFGSVQLTMFGYGLWHGERFNRQQTTGLVCASGGLLTLLLPGLAAPPPGRAALMIVAGAAWGLYSLRAKGVADPVAATAGNFLRAAVLALLLWIACLPSAHYDASGIAYAVVSGALASGLGYVVWYAALQHLTATMAATAQLSVPVLATLGGIVLLAEPVTWHLLAASIAVIGGMAIVIVARR